MTNKNFSSGNQVGKMLNLMQAAKDNEQPMTIQMTSEVFLQCLDYSAGLRLDAYKQEQEKEKQLAEKGDEVSPKEAMAMAHVSPATLWRYAQQGILHKKNVGGKVYYSRAEITNLLKG